MQPYREKRVREVCHAVKEGNMEAINEMAGYFLNLGIIDSQSVIIPAPQHNGRADYTLSVARIVASKTGARIDDILRCIPHEKLYDQKKRGLCAPPQFYTVGIAGSGPLYFLDNVFATGTTFNGANRLFHGRLNPLIYSKT